MMGKIKSILWLSAYWAIQSVYKYRLYLLIASGLMSLIVILYLMFD